MMIYDRRRRHHNVVDCILHSVLFILSRSNCSVYITFYYLIYLVINVCNYLDVIKSTVWVSALHQ